MKTAAMEAEFLTYEQAARLLQVGASTVRAWCSSGRLRRYGAGRVVRVRREEVLAVLQPTGASEANDDAAAKAAAILAKGRAR